MRQFIVPQFIEHEAKIVGPLTFKQLIFVGVAAAICFFFYFTVSFYIFLLISIPLMAGGIALAILRIEGRPLAEVLKDFFLFLFAPKLYLWKKKMGLPPKFIEKPRVKPQELARQSHLQSLSAKIETKK